MLLCSTVVRAQEMFSFGVRTGVGHATTGDIPAGYTRFPDYGERSSVYRAEPEGTFGPEVGIFCMWDFTTVMALRAELLYTTRHVRYNLYPVPGTEPVADAALLTGIEFGMRYMEIPLLAVVSLPTQSVVRPFIQGGIVPALFVGDDERAVERGRYILSPSPTLLSLRLAGGAGVRLQWASVSAGLEARYVYGLTSVVEDSGVTNLTPASAAGKSSVTIVYPEESAVLNEPVRIRVHTFSVAATVAVRL